ncbi:alpha/beta-hydrolase [Choiromyces venosus 120613-1]|uniref:Alpha/beta-hydrolase n=1 Tax=Choiromyces venosus 120613-1 TaxID=1336337 RepID=A0A3N4J1I0_9PEZI|nr:alpha/beta-hydrolase [Choiromyces venosus 120613-1]
MFSPTSPKKSNPNDSLKNASTSLGTSGLPDHAGSAYWAIEITSTDTVIETADGHRLPGVPIEDARKLNALRSEEEEEEHERDGVLSPPVGAKEQRRALSPGLRDTAKNKLQKAGEHLDITEERVEGEGNTNIEKAPALTNPLFPPLPVYGPPTFLRRLQSMVFRVCSGILSLCFLFVVVMGTIFRSLPYALMSLVSFLRGRDPNATRPFYEIEKDRAEKRKEEIKAWKVRRRDSQSGGDQDGERGLMNKEITGGKDNLVCDIRYYTRRVGLDAEEFEVETEDGFLITMQHIYDPDDPPYYPSENIGEKNDRGKSANGKRRKYPVLLMHGLLQSSGAFCVNDEDSLAFFLCKAGYDVWLGNNRCGFKPKHTILHYSDPRMWAWNIRQMGIIDLPALIDHVLSITHFPKLGLICHSQGTTQTFVALAKQQRPDIGAKISVFCALAPAVYAGPLIDKFYFKFMKIISPSMFRMVFGIHAFIPFMMLMHATMPAKVYGALGYRVFWFLFGWSDVRWDKGLRDRFFQFAPVFVSAEAMRWWLGRECFAKHKCILTTKSEEEGEDQAEEDMKKQEKQKKQKKKKSEDSGKELSPSPPTNGGPWYDERCPPMAFWVAGNDDLVDGRRLIRRFEMGKEPDVNLIHAKVIEEYEHLDVIWAVDAPQQVFKELVDVLWKCVDEDAKREVIIPRGIGESGIELRSSIRVLYI